ncbi:MAG: S9 family peptidase [Chloroflexota bacterium]
MTNASPRPIAPEDLLALQSVSDAQLSPDGSRVAYVVTTIDAEHDEYRSAIWVVLADGHDEPTQFTRGAQSDTAPRWSPNGDWLAFLSDRDGKPAQLYVMPAHGGEARKLTSLVNGAGAAVWSPDGTRILFAARVLKETPPADTEARTRWEQRPKHVTRAQYKDDGQGYTFDAVSQLFVIAADGGDARQITQGDAQHRAPSWSFDGKQIAFSQTRDGVGDFNLSDIWVMDADGGNARRITENIGRATSPSWSPDSAHIACYGTEQQVAGLGDPIPHVWVVPLDGSTPRALTMQLDRGTMLLPPPAATPGPVWSDDGNSLTFNIADAGNVHVARAMLLSPLQGEEPRVKVIVSGERQVTSSSVSRTAKRIAFVVSEPSNPSDLFECDWDGANERRLTRVNESLFASLQLPRIERRTFNNPNGGTIDGWVTHPLTSDGPAPLLVDIHGGPHSFHGNGFALGYFYRYALAAKGWAVLALNPTGSGSYGKAFAHDIRGRWGEHDLPEQLAAVDALIAEGVADGNRLAVAGYSYGGFMTAWTVGHTDRFKAAVIGAPVTNLESFHGTSDIGLWFGAWEMNGDLFGNRELFRRLSPITTVERVTTPSLILHGEGDDRCPISQGEEFYIGLIAAGNAPTEFVRYPGGSHLFIISGRPSHRVDYCRRVIEWIERYT